MRRFWAVALRMRLDRTKTAMDILVHWKRAALTVTIHLPFRSPEWVYATWSHVGRPLDASPVTVHV
jgi:hypothetical protein